MEGSLGSAGGSGQQQLLHGFLPLSSAVEEFFPWGMDSESVSQIHSFLLKLSLFKSFITVTERKFSKVNKTLITSIKFCTRVCINKISVFFRFCFCF